MQHGHDIVTNMPEHHGHSMTTHKSSRASYDSATENHWQYLTKSTEHQGQDIRNNQAPLTISANKAKQSVAGSDRQVSIMSQVR